jgi:hypothetical protein
LRRDFGCGLGRPQNASSSSPTLSARTFVFRYFLILTNSRVPGVCPIAGKDAFVGEIFLECGGEASAFAKE